MSKEIERSIKELDRIVDKNGRTGTVMLILYDDNKNMGLSVEFDDIAPEIEVISADEVVKLGGE